MITSCPQEVQQEVFEYLERRFGFASELFDGFTLYSGAHGTVLLGPLADFDLSLAETTGILVVRRQRGIKPSSIFFQMFGKYVTKNTVELTAAQTRAYLRGEDLELSSDTLKRATDGYVLLKYTCEPVACGLLKGNVVKNVLPKASRLRIEFL